MYNKKYSASRRGVLLLLILGMLAMFGVLAIAFVILAGQQRRGFEAALRAEAYPDPPEQLLNQAAAQVLRGTNDPASVLRPHSLLEDVYGHPWVIGVFGTDDDVDGTIDEIDGSENIGTAGTDDDGDGVTDERDGTEVIIPTTPGDLDTTACNGQFIEFTIPDVYRKLGCVLTMLNGPAAGQSTRIVGVHVITTTAPYTYKAQLLRFQSSVPTAGNAYAINGPAFGGTGVGHNIAPAAGSTIRGDATDSNGYLYALVPNPLGRTSAELDAAGRGGANENYDAPDLQNMLLGLLVPVSPAADIDLDGDLDTIDPRFPSLHRPELANYWFRRLVADPSFAGFTWPGAWTTDDLKWRAVLQPLGRDAKIGGTGADADFALDSADPARAERIAAFKRKFLFRPLAEYHPSFTGSNAAARPDISGWTLAQLAANNWHLTGPWDVDNDGDGTADSLWVDLGMPVRSFPDGRRYKPLFAILCLDLDGRLNLNAAGSTAQLNSAYATGIAAPYAGTDGATATLLPRGSGYGPADMGLAPIVASADVQPLLRGDSTSGVEGRYGENTTGSAEAGIVSQYAPLSLIAHFDFPDDYTAFPTSGLTSFLTPPDLWARASLALDYLGQPYYTPLAWSGERQNNPYVAKLSDHWARQAIGSRVPAGGNGANVDNPFTLAELERLLRQYDLDAGILSSRLWDLATSVRARRLEVTSDSVDLPGITTNLEAPAQAQTSGGYDRYSDVTAMLRRALVNGGFADPSDALTTQMQRMLSWDLLRRMQFDVNRPFGNGRDSDGDSLVDEPDEVTAESGWNPPMGSAVSFDPTNGVDVDGDGASYLDTDSDGIPDTRDPDDVRLARQLYARHLFVLLMLLRDAGYVVDTATATPPETLTASQQGELTIRRIAQWAANAVDFRDADSIMTPFEYDPTPFNGWSVDGNVGTDEGGDRRLVWGCESPELLLTETLAFHDRRVADMALDNGDAAERSDDADSDDVPDDDDLDQAMVPQGSAFFELYCPRNRNNAVAPPDLYTYNSSTGVWYLDLGRLSPATAGGQTYPVWRMAITVPHPDALNPNSNVAARLAARPHSTSLDPEQLAAGASTANGFSLLSTAPDLQVQIDRIVWFAALDPTGYADADRIYYRQSGAASALLEPGRYALVGPRPTTSIGSQQGTGVDINRLGIPSDHQISLGSVSVQDNDGVVRYPDTTTNIHVPIGMVVAANPPASWAAVPGSPTIGINVSEPLFSSADYYAPPTAPNPRNGGVQEAYGDLAQTGAATFLDEPEDGATGTPLEGLTGTGTHLNFCSTMLQRLANPAAPYDPVTNPYLTVDWMPVDLTVFNGTDREPVAWPPATEPTWTVPPYYWDPDDPTPDTGATAVRMMSRQRGTVGGLQNLWAQAATALTDWTQEPLDTDPTTGVTAPHFRHNLVHTVGYLNSTFGVPWNTTSHLLPAPAAYRGNPFDPTASPPEERAKQFPWLTWNNRPYTGPYELMLVPSSHPARLGLEFGLANASDPYADTNPAFGLPFQHLVNLYHSSLTAGGVGSGSPHLYRLLDYIDVPSRFVGNEKVLSPTVFGDTTIAAANLFRPPFNRLSTWREPGSININTIVSADIWTAVLNGHPGPTFDSLVQSRKGYGASGNMAELDPAYPTRFANPFRSGGSADLVPLTTMRRDAVNTTLLRASGANADASSTPLLAATSTLPYNHTNRNAYFRYAPTSRLASLVTTRSNVYAVWITVGFFEVRPAPSTLLGLDAAATAKLPFSFIFRVAGHLDIAPPGVAAGDAHRPFPVGKERRHPGRGVDRSEGDVKALPRQLEPPADRQPPAG
ncbi:MAG: hypothetical protein HUU20_27740, partial [Pirellulales bacterium]|nr:hypothetical protein [Pirellulales bacterium]